MIRPVPSRRQAIADDIRHQISTSHFKAGERLPSEAQLAARYKVSTPTLRSALALLEGEGLVEKIHGSGNFVRHPLRKITYVGGGVAEAIAPRGATVRRTAQLQAHGHLADLLNVPPLSPLTEIIYVTHEGKSPHSLARIYIPGDLTPTDSPVGSSVPVTIATRFVDRRPPLAEIQERLSARLPTQEEAAALRISTSLAVLSLTRVATDVTGRVVEAALLVLPGDRADALFTTRVMAADEEREEMTSGNELRLLPWSGPDNKPCFLSTEDAAGYLSRLADDIEETQLDLGSALLAHALEVLAEADPDPEELHLLATDLTGALRDAVRVATSRGHRLPHPAHSAHDGPPADSS